MRGMFRGMRYRVSLLAAVLWLVTSTAAADVIEPVRYRDCLVQEMRAPLPAHIARQSIPEGWGVVAYGAVNDRMATIGGTTLSCSFAGDEVRETWWWTEVVPPKRYQSRLIESYGFLLVAASTAPDVANTPRSCFKGWLSRAEISIEDLSTAPRIIHTRTRTRWGTDVSYVEGTERAFLATNSWRFFSSRSEKPGYEPGMPIRSFDINLDAEEALAGRALFGQNVADPSVDASSTTIMAPGYFHGDGLLIDSNVTFSGGGRTPCRND